MALLRCALSVMPPSSFDHAVLMFSKRARHHKRVGHGDGVGYLSLDRRGAWRPDLGNGEDQSHSQREPTAGVGSNSGVFAVPLTRSRIHTPALCGNTPSWLRKSISVCQPTGTTSVSCPSRNPLKFRAPLSPVSPAINWKRTVLAAVSKLSQVGSAFCCWAVAGAAGEGERR